MRISPKIPNSASGCSTVLYTLGIMIGMSVYDTTLGTTIGNLGMTDVKFPKPVFHGDTLKAHTRIISKRASKSRPTQGIVEFEHTMTNQRGGGGGELPPHRPDALRAEGVSGCDHSCSFPATATRKFENAKKTAADALILDLEDPLRRTRRSARGARCARCSMRGIPAEDLHPRQCARYRHDAWRPRRRHAGVGPPPPPPRRHRAAEMRRRRGRQPPVAVSRCLRGRRRDRTWLDANSDGGDGDGEGRPQAARLREHEPAAVGHDVGRRGSRGLARRVAEPDRRPLPRPVPAGARSLPDQRGGSRRRRHRYHRDRHQRPRCAAGRSPSPRVRMVSSPRR